MGYYKYKYIYEEAQKYKFYNLVKKKLIFLLFFLKELIFRTVRYADNFGI